MELNWIIFPAPSPPSYLRERDFKFHAKLIFIPYEPENEKEEDKDWENVVRTSFVKSGKSKNKIKDFHDGHFILLLF